jgi:acetyltransferase-like isoleucine patch superfamily enzyme
MPTNNPNIIFGKHSYGDIQIVGRKGGKVTIGKYCSLGGVVAFMSDDHNTHNISTFPFGHRGMPISKLMKPPLPGRDRYNAMRKLEVTVGNDVWIGTNAIIFRAL